MSNGVCPARRKPKIFMPSWHAVPSAGMAWPGGMTNERGQYLPCQGDSLTTRHIPGWRARLWRRRTNRGWRPRDAMTQPATMVLPPWTLHSIGRPGISVRGEKTSMAWQPQANGLNCVPKAFWTVQSRWNHLVSIGSTTWNFLERRRIGWE